MDVAAIGVGTDFVEQVERAISTSDASLVVIGPGWIGAADSKGHRRLDDPEDHVRSEVRSALASPHPVVPVLVGEASLPPADQLPDDLKALVRRQAVELRDETWSEDVEALVRRLEGKEAVRQPRRWIPVALGLMVLGVAGVLIWQTQAGGEDGATPLCEVPDPSWTSIEMLPEATAVVEEDGRSLRFTVVSAEATAREADWLTLLEVELDNETSGTGNQQGFYYGLADFEALLVDRIAYDPICFSPIAGDRDDLTPGQKAIGLVGFESTIDPIGAELMLGLEGGGVIQITPAT
jgi:hypothetical protein